MPLLQQLDDGLWSHPSTIRVGPLALPRRAVVVRLEDGGLWVHSPNALDQRMRSELAGLGRVEHVVAPGTMHHAHVLEWRSGYPDATFHAAPGLRRKKPHLQFDRELGEAPDAAWEGLLDQRVVRDPSGFCEVVFLHRPSRTLLLTDTAFHVGAEARLGTRLLMRLNGTYGRLGPTRMLRTLLKDVPGVRRAMLEVCDAWDFDRVHVAHGEPYPAGARGALRAAWEAV